MSKSPDAFRTISEVSETLDIPAHVLRFWESKFAQIKPVKRGGGRRYYRPEDIVLLRGIRELLYTDGMTIKGVQRIFAEGGPKQVCARGGGATPPAPVSIDAIEDIPAEMSADRAAALSSAIRKLEGLEKRLRGPVTIKTTEGED